MGSEMCIRDRAMPETYIGKALSLRESTGDQGVYDTTTGKITFPVAGIWARVGVAPQLSGQNFRFTSTTGHNVLYLHGSGGVAGLNSRGPGRSSTCLCKIPLDSRSPVNHISIQRPHRWISQTPGSLSILTFQLLDCFGNLHRLSDYGQNISFVLTWAIRD